MLETTLSRVSTNQLLRQRDLLKLHLMDSGRGGAQQRTGREKNYVLHGCDNSDRILSIRSESGRVKMLDRMHYN